MISKALMAASTTPIILSILLDGEDYGYNIIQRVKEASGGSLEWSDGMLYPVLQRLEKEGFVSSRWIVSEEGRHRKYYAITDDGRRELESEMAQWKSVYAAMARLCGPLPAVQ
ncbi:MAG: helix-turn-helix transcriptional regulator [Acidobacteriota bacterium]